MVATTGFETQIIRTAKQELTLKSALSDPLIRTLMDADNVDTVILESMRMRFADQVTPPLNRNGSIIPPDRLNGGADVPNCR
jgi:hypothetical protein